MTASEREPTPSHGRPWRQDLLASLVVFLVALPLCMGIALASGAPVAAGLVTGIVGGLLVGVLAGAPLQVSGPAAGLTVICGEVIRQHGMPALGIVVLIAGALQLLAGAFRIGRWFRAVSPAVIHGMLSGIGVLILSSQLHVMVDDRPRQNGVQNILSLPESVWKGLPLPAWEDASLRGARVELLQQFGKLHEAQNEIERGVSRIVTRHGKHQLDQWDRDHLADFVPRQEAVIAQLSETIAGMRESPVMRGDVEGAKELRAALPATQAALEKALDDLRERRVSGLADSQAAASDAIGDVLADLKNHDWAAKVGVLAILIILAWQFTARGRLKLVPAPLLAVAITTLAAWWLSLPVLYVEVPDNLVEGLTFPSWAVLDDAPLRELVVSGIIMAVIASAETLLCATAVDSMQSGPRTRYNQELMAQGLGNMICGVLGALPMTGVIVRSAANVQAGGKTRASAVLHGAWLLLFVCLFTPLLRMIPTAALAGILVFTGFKLIDFRGFVHLWRHNRGEAVIFLITLVVIVVEDLLYGVVTGFLLSSAKLLWQFSHLEVDLSRTQREGREVSALAISGAATFLRLPVLAEQLDRVPAGAELHVDFEHLEFIDHACLELLMNWAKQHAANGGKLVLDWDSLHARFRPEKSRRRTRRRAGNASGARRQAD